MLSSKKTSPRMNDILNEEEQRARLQKTMTSEQTSNSGRGGETVEDCNRTMGDLASALDEVTAGRNSEWGVGLVR